MEPAASFAGNPKCFKHVLQVINQHLALKKLRIFSALTPWRAALASVMQQSRLPPRLVFTVVISIVSWVVQVIHHHAARLAYTWVKHQYHPIDFVASCAVTQMKITPPSRARCFPAANSSSIPHNKRNQNWLQYYRKYMGVFGTVPKPPTSPSNAPQRTNAPPISL